MVEAVWIRGRGSCVPELPACGMLVMHGHDALVRSMVRMGWTPHDVTMDMFDVTMDIFDLTMELHDVTMELCNVTMELCDVTWACLAWLCTSVT